MKALTVMALAAVFWLGGCATVSTRIFQKDVYAHSRWVRVGDWEFLYRDLTLAWDGPQPIIKAADLAQQLPSGVLTLPEAASPVVGVHDVAFRYGSATLAEEGRVTLRGLLDHALVADRIGICGTAGGTDKAAVHLASQRAGVVKQYLIDQGVSEIVIELDPYEPWIRGGRAIVSYGTTGELDTCRERDNSAQALVETHHTTGHVIPFEHAKATLTDNARATIDGLIQHAKQASRILVQGTAGGRAASLEALAARRARAVRDYLIDHGVDRSVVDLAEYDPYAHGRRVLVRFEHETLAAN